MSMDTKDQLPPDMVEQLLKFTPSAEEKALLEEHSDELKSLARADRFLYEISQSVSQTDPIELHALVLLLVIIFLAKCA